eukprot:757391-Hanusia_phi.AAC.4
MSGRCRYSRASMGPVMKISPGTPGGTSLRFSSRILTPTAGSSFPTGQKFLLRSICASSVRSEPATSCASEME